MWLRLNEVRSLEERPTSFLGVKARRSWRCRASECRTGSAVDGKLRESDGRERLRLSGHCGRQQRVAAARFETGSTLDRGSPEHREMSTHLVVAEQLHRHTG